MTDERQKMGISRRTLVKGAAWAVPAVPIVVATPAYAASPQCLTVTLGGTACKFPGAGSVWSYKLVFCFTNSCGATYDIWITRITNNSGKPFTQCGECALPINNTAFPIPPGTNCDITCYFSSESSAHSVEIWGSFTGPVSGTNPEVMLMATDAPTVPCQNIPNPCLP